MLLGAAGFLGGVSLCCNDHLILGFIVFGLTFFIYIYLSSIKDQEEYEKEIKALREYEQSKKEHHKQDTQKNISNASNNSLTPPSSTSGILQYPNIGYKRDYQTIERILQVNH